MGGVSQTIGASVSYKGEGVKGLREGGTAHHLGPSFGIHAPLFGRPFTGNYGVSSHLSRVMEEHNCRQVLGGEDVVGSCCLQARPTPLLLRLLHLLLRLRLHPLLLQLVLVLRVCIV